VDLIKGKPTKAFGYELTFTEYHPIENNTKYAFNVDIKKDGSEYNLKPIMYISEFNNSLVREPAILTLPTRDLYLSPLGYDDGNQSNANGKSVSVALGSEFDFNNAKIKYTEFIRPDISAMQSGGNIQMGTKLTVSKDNKSYEIIPMIKREGGQFEYVAAELQEANLKIEVKKIDPGSEQAEFIVSKLNDNGADKIVNESNEVLTLTASIKPFISLVWIGVLIMVFGFFISMARRLKESMIIS